MNQSQQQQQQQQHSYSSYVLWGDERVCETKGVQYKISIPPKCYLNCVGDNTYTKSMKVNWCNLTIRNFNLTKKTCHQQHLFQTPVKVIVSNFQIGGPKLWTVLLNKWKAIIQGVFYCSALKNEKVSDYIVNPIKKALSVKIS